MEKNKNKKLVADQHYIGLTNHLLIVVNALITFTYYLAVALHILTGDGITASMFQSDHLYKFRYKQLQHCQSCFYCMFFLVSFPLMVVVSSMTFVT